MPSDGGHDACAKQSARVSYLLSLNTTATEITRVVSAVLFDAEKKKWPKKDNARHRHVARFSARVVSRAENPRFYLVEIN